MGKGDPKASSSAARTALRITALVRPHWKTLSLAIIAVVGETLADVLQPWPIKVVVDNVLQSKKLPAALGAIVDGLFAGNKYATLNFAVAALALIAIVGAVSGYLQKYLTTRVSQWVGHDLHGKLGDGRTHIKLSNVNGAIHIQHANDGHTLSPVKNLIQGDDDKI